MQNDVNFVGEKITISIILLVSYSGALFLGLVLTPCTDIMYFHGLWSSCHTINLINNHCRILVSEHEVSNCPFDYKAHS